VQVRHVVALIELEPTSIARENQYGQQHVFRKRFEKP